MSGVSSVLCLAVILTSLVATWSTGPPSSYQLFPGVGYYRLSANLTSWSDAYTTCNSEGAHLTVVSSAEEARVLKTLFSHKTDLPPYAHIGVHGLFRKGRFHTIFGEPFRIRHYIFWETKPVRLPTHSCVSFSRSGKLAVEDCEELRPFFCEFHLPEKPLEYRIPAIQSLMKLVQRARGRLRNFAEHKLQEHLEVFRSSNTSTAHVESRKRTNVYHE